MRARFESNLHKENNFTLFPKSIFENDLSLNKPIRKFLKVLKETSLIAPMLPTVITIVIDMIVHDGFRLIIANKNAQKKRNPKTYVEFQFNLVSFRFS